MTQSPQRLEAGREKFVREAFAKLVLSPPKYSWLKFVRKGNQPNPDGVSKHSLRDEQTGKYLFIYFTAVVSAASILRKTAAGSRPVFLLPIQPETQQGHEQAESRDDHDFRPNRSQLREAIRKPH